VQEVVEELPLEFEQLLPGEDAPVGVAERARVVEGPRVALAVHRELRVVHVSGQLGLVLVLLVLGLEGLDAVPAVLAGDEADDLDVVVEDGLQVVVVVVGQEFVHVELAGRVEGLLVAQRVGASRRSLRSSMICWRCSFGEQHQRVLVHRGGDGVVVGVLVVDDRTEVRPPERVQPPLLLGGVVLVVASHLPVDVGLAGADGTEQEDDALLRSEATSAALDLVHELVDGLVDFAPEERVRTLAKWVLGCQFVLDDPVLRVRPVVVEHVRKPLVGVPGDGGVVVQGFQIPVVAPSVAEV